jgi:hypothetical protein
MAVNETEEAPIGAAAIAKELKLSEAKVKKLIQELGIAPAATRGICKFYSRDAIEAIRKAVVQK